MTGKRKTNPFGLPPRVYENQGWFYFSELRPGKTAKWHRLGKLFDLNARLTWAKLSGEAPMVLGKRSNIAELLEEFIAQCVKNNHPSPRSIKDYASHSVMLKEAFGLMRPGDLESEAVQFYLENRKNKKTGLHAAARANKEIVTLRTAFDWGRRLGMVPKKHNPFDDTKANKLKKTKKYAPTLIEIRAVQKHFNEQWQAVIELALLVGQRGVDLRKLKHSDCTEKGVLFEQSKTDARVLIEWDPSLRRVMDRLRAIRKQDSDSVYICPSEYGEMYTPDGWQSMFYKGVRRALAAGDVTRTFGFHEIRASNATLEKEAGGSAQHRLGHASPEQTEDYERSIMPTKAKPLRLVEVA